MKTYIEKQLAKVIIITVGISKVVNTQITFQVTENYDAINAKFNTEVKMFSELFDVPTYCNVEAEHHDKIDYVYPIKDLVL